MIEMKNKYYTPEIEEFHVGFEYELQNIENAQWGIFKMTHLNWDDENKWDLEDDRIRVKYLDREDIESAGFRFIGKTIDDWYELIETRKSPINSYYCKSFTLRHDYKDNEGIEIIGYEYNNKSGEEGTLFKGTCKNKSELIKIMKQINLL